MEIQLVSSAGRGTAECRYVFTERVKDVVVCVPSAISLGRAAATASAGTTQLVKVTKCRMEVQEVGHTRHSASLQLTKLDSEYSTLAKTLPSYASIKKSLKRSISPEDLVLYLGHFEANTTLVLEFEFLVQLRMLSGESGTEDSTEERQTHFYFVENNILSKHVLYKLRLASHLSVTDISPSPSSSAPASFTWAHVDKAKRVVQVSYESSQQQGRGEEGRSARAVAFRVELCGDQGCSPQSACCNCLAQTPTNNVSSRHPQKYDGVMMLSSRITRDQLSSSSFCLRDAPPPPSEFVFLIDCSASMNPFIDGVIATLITSIKSLPEGCYFNLIAFGSNYRQLFQESSEYSKTSVKYAVDFANQLKASLGGTELLPPLKWIYKTSRRDEMPCQIFIITDVDQEVKDVPYVLSTIKKHRHYTR